MQGNSQDGDPQRSLHSKLVIRDAVAVFSHNRPDERNALSEELQAGYVDMLDRIQSDSRIRALVITGSGGSFCAGGDLKLLAARLESRIPEERIATAVRNRVATAQRWIDRLRSLEMPVIAAVDGPAMGAGFSIALAADFIFASPRARFCMSFAKVGLVPDLGAFYLLPRIVGLPVAKELALTARRVNAEEGKRLGLVHSIFEHECLLDEAVRFAARFADGPRDAIGLTKSLLNNSFETNFTTMAELERQSQAIASTTPYHAAALESFIDRQPLKYDWDLNKDAQGQ